MANGLVKELREVEPAVLPDRDVRAGKPLLSGVLRFDLLRASARMVTLATLDLAGLFLAIYSARAQRPGLPKVIASLFQTTLVVLIYAEIEGEPFQSYYIFYGSLIFALLYVSSLRWIFERASGAVLRAAGYRRRAVLVGSGSNIQAVSHALGDSREIEPYGFVARTPVPLMDGLRDFRSLEQLERHFDAIDEVLIT